MTERESRQPDEKRDVIRLDRPDEITGLFRHRLLDLGHAIGNQLLFDTETTKAALHFLFPQAGRDALDHAITHIGFHTNSIKLEYDFDRLLRVPGRRSRIARMAVGEEVIRLASEPESVFPESIRSRSTRAWMLSPVAYGSYPFVMDAGIGLSDLEGFVVERYGLLAVWITTPGSIAIRAVADMNHMWTPESVTRLEGYKRRVMHSVWEAAVLQRIRSSTPFSGGLPGFGKKG